MHSFLTALNIFHHIVGGRPICRISVTATVSSAVNRFRCAIQRVYWLSCYLRKLSHCSFYIKCSTCPPCWWTTHS